MSLPMPKLRIPLYLALVLLCVSLTGDLDAHGAVTSADGSWCQPARVPEGGFSGGLLLEIAEPVGIGNQADHSAAAVLDAAALRSPHGDSGSRAQGVAAAPPAPSTPLYLSHCVFLC
ncbi:MAG: hypothetical protein GY719_43380 [bacterium]|nr:hypothetical protein [bacterium]